MQSDRRRAGTPPSRLPPSGLDVADLDRPIREVLPELARGLAALARLGVGARPPRGAPAAPGGGAPRGFADESGTAEAIWFGRQFVEQRLARIAPGDELI